MALLLDLGGETAGSVLQAGLKDPGPSGWSEIADI